MPQTDLFSKSVKKDRSKRPLADLYRPENLKDFIGQKKLVGGDGPVRRMIENDDLVSMILWGPPGCGKTTLAQIIAKETKSYFVSLSAVSAGKGDVAKVIESAKEIYQAYEGRRTILFLDEIHRFNKAQQDYLLPYVEDGTIILIGATTENPSFEVNSALLSRTRVFILEKLSQEDLKKIVSNVVAKLKSENELEVKFDKTGLDYLVKMANGDSRAALNTLELAVKLAI